MTFTRFKRIETGHVLLVWVCPECGQVIEQPVDDLVEVGIASCCDGDCVLDYIKVSEE